MFVTLTIHNSAPFSMVDIKIIILPQFTDLLRMSIFRRYLRLSISVKPKNLCFFLVHWFHKLNEFKKTLSSEFCLTKFNFIRHKIQFNLKNT